jgi:peptidoglycan/LPS O-acetylase OafA/YrhL
MPAETSSAGRAISWPALDGMRAFSVVAVMLFHFYYPHFFPGGYLGVDVFFVLSGFLITSLLARELDAAHSVDLKAFYIRRALRLFPALFAVLIVFSVVVSVDPGLSYVREDTLRAVPFVALYVGNIREIHHSLGLFSHTWSLALEEQFYIIFPAIFIILSRLTTRLNAARILFLAAALETAYRPILLVSGLPLGRLANNHDIAGVGGLLIGAGLALWLASPDRYRPRDAVVHAAASVGVVSLIVMVCVTGQTHAETAIWYTLTPLAAAAILLDQVTVPQRWLAWVLTTRPALWTGRRSYGLYLWHYPLYFVFLWTVPAPKYLVVRQIAVFILSFIVAAASYQVIEKPALRLKARYQRVAPVNPSETTGEILP